MLPPDRRLRRFVQLFVGLYLYGLSSALMIRAQLGLDPWDVFHQGLVKHTGLSFGAITIIVGAVVMLGWIPLRQKPGIGTISNVIVVGLAVDASLAFLPTPQNLVLRIVFLVAGVVLCGFATGCYVGAGMGPGPRDGLMTGLVARTGKSVRLVRTCIEVSVLVVGFLLGGSVGFGTLFYALTIGPLVHVFLPLMKVRTDREADTVVALRS
ncbi:YczE/YyaS/YitT family protein [Fodinicola acaciae]|uniref:membrane protein YczE n=1 Tax=Fodinicola acaciae TaxID=2681555 RepID=UPI001C9E2694|nr:hypothetical protein [Fodinicola acaciae]